uniref:SWIM-type domain-containing protein n=1 Tax=Trypanosoma vivax (strain Y486) TaxID=1055687 RepID=G0U7J9_TRYVY|nr:conserved hypothetical protein [Trypanosoma vivax Y486]
MHFPPACEIPALLTSLSLSNYAQYLTAEHTTKDSAATATVGTPASLESVLAPLYLIHGKVFASAVGITIHREERIVRYVANGTDDKGDAKTTQSDRNANEGNENTSARLAGRHLYFVGERCLLSPYYCSCPAYNYSGIRRQESWACKHMLALQIALLLEKHGLSNDCIVEQTVSSNQFMEMSQGLL